MQAPPNHRIPTTLFFTVPGSIVARSRTRAGAHPDVGRRLPQRPDDGRHLQPLPGPPPQARRVPRAGAVVFGFLMHSSQSLFHPSALSFVPISQFRSASGTRLKNVAFALSRTSTPWRQSSRQRPPCSRRLRPITLKPRLVRAPGAWSQAPAPLAPTVPLALTAPLAPTAKHLAAQCRRASATSSTHGSWCVVTSIFVRTCFVISFGSFMHNL